MPRIDNVTVANDQLQIEGRKVVADRDTVIGIEIKKKRRPSPCASRSKARLPENIELEWHLRRRPHAWLGFDVLEPDCALRLVS